MTFALDNELGYCPICTMDLETKSSGLKIVQLSCNFSHAMHEECFEAHKKFKSDHKQKLDCPYCRAELDLNYC
jgi:C4-type Zn-finger protein